MTNPLPVPIHLLPGCLQTLAERCGAETMWMLWDQYGGRHICIPRAPIAEHELTLYLGFSAMQQLSYHFGGETLMIPRAHAAQLRVRNAFIRAGRANGMPNWALAREYHLTERQIIDICTRAEPSPNPIQPDLFCEPLHNNAA